MWVIFGWREETERSHAYFVGIYDNEQKARDVCMKLNKEQGCNNIPMFEVRKIQLNVEYPYEWSNMMEEDFHANYNKHC